MLAKCDKCHWKYPDVILQQMFVGRGYTPPICGICALEITNEGLPKRIQRKQFQGVMAEDFRQRAISWRNKHPHHKES